MNFYTKMHPLIKCSFSSLSGMLFYSINCLFKGKDLVEVSMIPPLRGLGNDTSNPSDLSSVNNLGNLIPPSFALSLSDRSLSLITDYQLST